MFKKTLISLAVASSLGLTGCLSGADEGGNANPDYQIEDTTIDRSLVRPFYNPNPLAGENAAFPINSDLILLLGATQSANFDFTGLSTGKTPADDAVNRLSGFSTSGAFSLKFDGTLNPASVMANATVFLVPLNVGPALASAPLALPNTNPSSIVAANPFGQGLGFAQPNFRADVVSLDGGSNNAVRVVPLEPLEKGQKYLVIITDDVVGANGKPIARSVQDVALADGTLGNPALGNVKSLLQNLNALANGFLAVNNTGSESALAYSFTTNSDTDVLRAMMAPVAGDFGAALGQKIGFTANLKVIRDNYPTLNFSELTTKLGEIAAKAEALGLGQLDPSTLTATELAAITRLGQIKPLITPTKIGAEIAAEIGDTLHIPVPRPSFFFPAESATTLATIGSLDAANSIKQAAQQVQVSQGAIALPYFQNLPGESGAGIVTGSWSGNTSLETDLNENLAPGEKIFSFLRDIDGKLNVNGYFPFPQKNASTTVPVVIFHPVLDGTGAQPTSCVNAGAGKPNGVTILQHGITVDRSVSMLPAILLAQSACQTVVAIDQPLHGLAGATNGSVPGLDTLDETTLTAKVNLALQGPDVVAGSQLEAQLNALIGADYIGERHFGYTNNGQLEPVAADPADISSGSLFINPGNMMNSRDNLRQGVVDLLNVAASIQTFDIDGDLTTQGDLAGVPVNFVGHSLGGISGTAFATLANDPLLNGTLNGVYTDAGLNPLTFPTLNSVVLHDTSGQVTRLIENSPGLSSSLLNGLAAAGVTQGSSKFESFFYVFQSILDASDPVSFAKELGASTTNILITEVVGDATVPNEANVEPLGNALSAPLAGTEPLMALIDLGAGGVSLADGSEGLGIIDTSTPTGSAMPAASFFAGTNPCAEANHGTFVAPLVPNANCPGGAADTSVAFSAMVTQTAAALSGPGIPGDASQAVQASLGASLTIDKALDQN
ncbi:virulence factor lipase N-terminal [Marinobacter sp. LV10R510-11A]|uniref:MECDP-synthase n=1 Tax=Marinobacter sp. LV10R510-11A TaxID=1415568 RepID=UPI000BB8BB5B|nr:MECDP-synthase [Marinobacter sp. LV10R510-11A]SOB76117.1 virulence factor lipase N-terminal [Marinobacter sp. LV10R510-11A]